jgi:hypothetical protein
MRSPSIQSVIYFKDGERQIVEMRCGVKFPARLAFNARSDKLTTSPFWKTADPTLHRSRQFDAGVEEDNFRSEAKVSPL